MLQRTFELLPLGALKIHFRRINLHSIEPSVNTRLTQLGLVQVQRESDGLIDLMEFFRRECRDALLDQNFRQSRDIVYLIDHATGRHAVASIKNNFHGNISSGTSDRCNGDRGAHPIRRIAAQKDGWAPPGGRWHINPPNLTALHLPFFFRQSF